MSRAMRPDTPDDGASDAAGGGGRPTIGGGAGDATDVADLLRARVQAAVIHVIADVVLFNHVVAQRVGLGGSDSQFMTLLDVHGPLTPGELARLTGMTTGTVTGVLDRLERGGFVQRTRDSADRRKVVVTRRDDVIAQKILPHYRGQAIRLDSILRTRSPEELEVIAGFLEALTAAPAEGESS